VVQTLAKSQISEVLAGSYQDRVQLAAAAEDGLVLDTRIEFSDEQHVVAASAGAVDKVLVNILVRDDLHPALTTARPTLSPA
jgi:hypothetical protein